MKTMDLFRPMKEMTLSPRVTLSLRARNGESGAETGEKSVSVGGTVTLLEALGALAAAGLVLKAALCLYRRRAVKKARKRLETRFLKAKKKEKTK